MIEERGRGKKKVRWGRRVRRRVKKEGGKSDRRKG